MRRVDSERILDHFLSLSSDATTLFILVPSGSPFFPMSAQALSSKLTTIPSFLCEFFLVRTTIACLMSPRLTLFAAATAAAPPKFLFKYSLKVRAFWTTTMMRSPTPECLFIRIFATHSTTRAPELSTQFSIVLSCIIVAAC